MQVLLTLGNHYKLFVKTKQHKVVLVPHFSKCIEKGNTKDSSPWCLQKYLKSLTCLFLNKMLSFLAFQKFSSVWRSVWRPRSRRRVESFLTVSGICCDHQWFNSMQQRPGIRTLSAKYKNSPWISKWILTHDSTEPFIPIPICTLRMNSTEIQNFIPTAIRFLKKSWRQS